MEHKVFKVSTCPSMDRSHHQREKIFLLYQAGKSIHISHSSSPTITHCSKLKQKFPLFFLRMSRICIISGRSVNGGPQISTEHVSQGSKRICLTSSQATLAQQEPSWLKSGSGFPYWSWLQLAVVSLSWNQMKCTHGKIYSKIQSLPFKRRAKKNKYKEYQANPVNWQAGGGGWWSHLCRWVSESGMVWCRCPEWEGTPVASSCPILTP